ncbi:MAG TPA: FAD-dependent oxidoreductase [Longimicrobiales bacterium]|nr:FAD-dependent oxidoreductase [Longimicrobiales bacterium]
MAGLHVVILGAGFAGAVLARILRRQGHEVRLLERGVHPRFALGESSTPLAAICLERLAARYGLEDLHHLAAYDRWVRHLPDVRRGLKRGFTFYAHRPGKLFENNTENANRLLVAASPHDGVADAHWLRQDVDHFLVRQAVAEGVGYLDRVEVSEVRQRGGAVRLSAVREGRPFEVSADLVVDASGGGGALAQLFTVPTALSRVRLDTGLVFGHFTGVRPFAEAAPAAEFPPGPYPDERAAVHHILAEGWMYVLPFDHDVVSAGFVIEAGDVWRSLRALPPERAWRHLLDRYPTLAAQFGEARAVQPIGIVPRLQRRLERSAGPNWALLPHGFSFLSPLFSTGIAWSLLGVERLALLLEPAAGGGANKVGLEQGLARYATLLEREADHLEELVGGAYRARHDFDVFCAYSYLYFAAVSYAEARQRLLPPPEAVGSWAWDGFAGSSDPVMRDTVAQAGALLTRLPTRRDPRFAAEYFNIVRRLIAPRNVAGLADPARRRLYPVDLEALFAAAPLLGLGPDEIRRALPRLRGTGKGVVEVEAR